jgi:hypothetical protein
MNVDRVNKEKKNQKLNEARSERELRETLQQIEKAARDAMAADGNEKYAAPAPRTSLPSQVKLKLHRSVYPLRSYARFDHAVDLFFRGKRLQGQISALTSLIRANRKCKRKSTCCTTSRPSRFDAQFIDLFDHRNSGFYTIRDKTYLDGKVFQEKLQDGRRCEIFVEV